MAHIRHISSRKCNFAARERRTLAVTASPLEDALKCPAVQRRGDAGGRLVAVATCSGPSRHLSTRCTPNWRCRRQASSPARTNRRTASVASAPTMAPILSSDSFERPPSTDTGRPRVRRSSSSSSLCDLPINARTTSCSRDTRQAL